MRTAYKCRAYPDPMQAQASAYLTAMKTTDELTWLNKAKAARAHRKVRAARADFLHKASPRLVRDHDVIVLEDLAVKNMIRNRTLAKAIADCGWGTFRAMTAYKAARAAQNILAAGLAVAGDTLPGHACRADVRHPGSSRVQSAVKQEPQPARAGIPVLQGGE